MVLMDISSLLLISNGDHKNQHVIQGAANATP